MRTKRTILHEVRAQMTLLQENLERLESDAGLDDELPDEPIDRVGDGTKAVAERIMWALTRFPDGAHVSVLANLVQVTGPHARASLQQMASRGDVEKIQRATYVGLPAGYARYRIGADDIRTEMLVDGRSYSPIYRGPTHKPNGEPRISEKAKILNDQNEWSADGVLLRASGSGQPSTFDNVMPDLPDGTLDAEEGSEDFDPLEDF